MSAGNKSILIVEDEVLLAMNTKLSLEDNGYHVAGIATTAGQTLSIIDKGRPDAVLVDIKLSGEMNGIDLAKKIMRDYGIPVIYITGNTDERTIRRAEETGPAGLLRKPLSDHLLISTLKKALDPSDNR
jgi:CheY-like chemotaxis protein